MPRNLDHRIEVVVPVEDQHVRNELESIFKALLADNRRRGSSARTVLGARAAEEERAPPFGAGVVHAAPRSRSTPGARALRSAVLWGRHHPGMPIGVVDVGSNTVRLLIKSRGRSIRTEREMLRLGADVELHGRISEAKLDATRSVVAGFAEIAREEGVQQPRDPDHEPWPPGGERAASLPRRLADAADCPVRVLSAPEEGTPRVPRRGRGRRAAAAPRRRRRRRGRRLRTGRRRHAPFGPAVAALDRSRLTTAHEPPAQRRPARGRRSRARARGGRDPSRQRRPAEPAPGARRRRQRPGREADRRQQARCSGAREVLSLLAVTPTDEVGDRFGIGDERARTLPRAS